jgi:hypothetical protein
MNLSVRSGLNNFKTEIDKLRSLVSKIRNSSLKTQIFKKCCDNFEINFLKPKIDMIVRWNSIHEMISWALNFKRIINDLRFHSDEFKYFDFKENDWLIFENLNEMLQPFKEATQIISGSTASTVLPVYDNLVDHLNSLKTPNDSLKMCANLMLEKLLEYEKLLRNDYSILATIFDPRFKLDYFQDKS